jgi:hypothetical protein
VLVIGLFIVLSFWLLVIALLFIAAMFVVVGPVGGVITAIVLLGLWFVTLHRILRRFRASREAVRRAISYPLISALFLKN